VIADELLGVARSLLREQGRRPRQVYLRRAVSSTYYALFHGLAQFCADELVGSSKRNTEAWRRAYRALDHGFGRNSLAEVARQRTNLDLARIADAFVVLQQARNNADYDPHIGYTRGAVAVNILQAERALEALRALPPAIRLELATSVLLRSRR
jgi:hypothetical protein